MALLFGLLACGKGSSSGASGKLKVVTTNSILADITKILLRIRSICTVSFLSAKILTVRTASRRCQRLRKADLIFYNRINLETGGNAWFTKLVKSANKVENKETISQLATESTSSTWKAKTKLEKKTLTLGSISKTGSSTLKNIAKQLIAKIPK